MRLLSFLSRPDHALLTAGLLVAIACISVFPVWTVDDAFITYRYAENLAFSGELTWNVGEDPVEGYTGVALPALLSLAVGAGIPADSASKAIGIAAFLGGALVFFLLLGLLAERRTVRGALTFLFLAAPMYVVHSTSGLETTLFGFVILLTLYLLQLSMHAGRLAERVLPWALVSSLFASLVRPEGAILAGLVLTATIAVRVSNRQSVFPVVYRAIAILLIPGLAYFAWRYWYYGLLMPNTYYAKWSRRFSMDSAVAFGKFMTLYGCCPLAAGALALIYRTSQDLPSVQLRSLVESLRPRLSVQSWQRIAVPLVGLGLCLIVGFQYSRSALIMNYAHRFFAPFYPILLIWIACALNIRPGNSSELPNLGGPRASVLTLLLGALFVLQLVLFAWMLPRDYAFVRDTKALLNDEHIPAAMYLRHNVPPHEWLVVVVDAGAIPYYSGLRTVDFGGLNDEFLAQRFRKRIPHSEIVDYFFARRPGAAVFTSVRPDRIEGPEVIPIQLDPRFADYIPVATYGSPRWPSYFEIVYVRRDLADGIATP